MELSISYGCACKNQRNTIGDRTGRILKKNTKARRSSSTVLRGKVYIEPDYTTISKIKQKQDENHTQVQNLNVQGKENITQSDRRLTSVQIGTREDIENVLDMMPENRLFRSEFLYIEMGQSCRQKNSSSVYRLAAEAMGTKKVVIRTRRSGRRKQVNEMFRARRR